MVFILFLCENAVYVLGEVPPHEEMSLCTWEEHSVWGKVYKLSHKILFPCSSFFQL